MRLGKHKGLRQLSKKIQEMGGWGLSASAYVDLCDPENPEVLEAARRLSKVKFSLTPFGMIALHKADFPVDKFVKTEKMRQLLVLRIC